MHIIFNIHQSLVLIYRYTHVCVHQPVYMRSQSSYSHIVRIECAFGFISPSRSFIAFGADQEAWTIPNTTQFLCRVWYRVYYTYFKWKCPCILRTNEMRAARSYVYTMSLVSQHKCAACKRTLSFANAVCICGVWGFFYRIGLDLYAVRCVYQFEYERLAEFRLLLNAHSTCLVLKPIHMHN